MIPFDPGLNDDFSVVVCDVRKKIGVSQSDFARLMLVSRVAVNQWEKGTIRPSRYHRELILSLNRIPKISNPQLVSKLLKYEGLAKALFYLLSLIFEKECDSA